MGADLNAVLHQQVREDRRHGVATRLGKRRLQSRRRLVPVPVWPHGDVTSGVCRTEPLVQMSFEFGSASPTSACSSGAHARARRPLLGTRYGARWPRTSRYAGVHPAGPLSPAGGNFSRSGCTQEALGDAADDSKAPVYDESWRASWNLLQQRQIMREREDGRRFLCGVHCTQQRRRDRRNPELLNQFDQI